ncbi:transposase [Pseudomonas extremaustralis]
MQPPRRSYSKPFKTQVIQECAQPGASIASVALRYASGQHIFLTPEPKAMVST